MRRYNIKIGNITLISCAVIFILAYVFFQISKSRSFQFFGGLTNRVNTQEKVVALTFDDAPTAYTSAVLDILRDKDVKATFYEIGQNIEKYPDIANRIVKEGMEVGNHSYSHSRFILKSQSFIKDEIEKTNELIRSTGYTGQITFRPPNGKKLIGLPWYLNKHNIKTITWDVEPDSYYNTRDGIINYTLEHTKPGSIILIHPFCELSCSADREALPIIIDKLKEQGFKFVTIKELLEYK